MRRLQRFAQFFCLAIALLSGCKPANTGGEAPPNDTPEPAPPADPYSNETYAAALRSASNKLRGRLPAVDDLTSVIDGGRPAYQAAIEKYLDTTQNPDLAPTLTRFFRKVFVMGEKTESVLLPGEPTDGTGQTVTLNYDEPANLATYIFVNDRSWREVFTADYCVDSTLNVVPCSGGSPVQSGILTNQPFLRQFGKINALNYQRTSVIHQLANCQIYPDGGDEGWARCNNCGDDPSTILPPDDPNAPLPRLHEKYQATMDSITCHACHRNLTTRRQVWSKFDVDGFYQANRTINSVEAASENFGACFVMPPGATAICPPNGNIMNPDGSQTACNTTTMVRECDVARTVDDNINRNPTFRCCYNPAFTDANSEDSVVCNDPTQPWCTGTYKGMAMQTPLDYANLLMDEAVNGQSFDVCQTRRFYAFALGLETGLLGLQAGDGIPPAATDAVILEKFRSSFAHSNYSVRALLRTLFLSDEFLSSQQ